MRWGLSGGVDRGTIPASEARAFANLYRYLPNFAALETWFKSAGDRNPEGPRRRSR
jgi:hypothetical protein